MFYFSIYRHIPNALVVWLYEEVESISRSFFSVMGCCHPSQAMLLPMMPDEFCNLLMYSLIIALTKNEIINLIISAAFIKFKIALLR